MCIGRCMFLAHSYRVSSHISCLSKAYPTDPKSMISLATFCTENNPSSYWELPAVMASSLVL